MAPPNGSTITNLSGTWVMDKTLSTNLDAVFKLQGISWILRKTISASSATLKITQGSDEDGEWMMLEAALAGGLQGTPEKRQLTWTEFEHNDTLFGRVIIRSHYISGQRTADGRVRPLVEPFTKVVVKPYAESILTEAVVLAPETAGAEQEKTDKAFIHDSIRSMYHEWTAEQIWAVEIVGEEQFLTRRVVVWKGSYAESAHIFYRLA
ncbi:hypothetical protein ANOM_007140 [Aspergillus nomiae NRRL 13137]|uniref:Uncharacterized protein n=1 Tax=Aspergillus nomiae NRRL (strain ATCC 15546 / NRRL 13137 / CBS 260.88 / M93) TaxID=1509407 RepID=A0A0L1J052_ASPN3|nr:uncharacterized protein ANOM_007140 [Aspergillus nomiae NRRL 13137]KNG85186.1 hypothetical protein ANOM_007140 [Aspergillus nomiae NRRL 13137]